MIVRFSKNKIIYLAMVLITLGNSQFFIALGVENIIEYVGLFLLLCGCYLNISLKSKKSWSNIIFLFVVMIFFCIGLLQQNMQVSTKIRLIVSGFILVSIAIMPSKFMSSFEQIRSAGYGILLGISVSTILAVLGGGKLYTLASEGFFVNFGFNGGLEHRNYYAYAVIASFMAIYVYYVLNEKRKLDKNILILELVLLLISNSRSSFIIMVIFLYFANYYKIIISQKNRTLTLVISIIMIIVGFLPLLLLLFTHSETFSFRINGLLNYLNKYGNDTYHMWFGTAAMAFRDSGMDYSDNVRSVIGWKGSVELVVLNILIKNGILGLIGYGLIFINYFKKIKKCKDKLMGANLYAIVVSFIISAFVESFLANINFTYTVMAYSLIAGLIQIFENYNSESEKKLS